MAVLSANWACSSATSVDSAEEGRKAAEQTVEPERNREERQAGRNKRKMAEPQGAGEQERSERKEAEHVQGKETGSADPNRACPMVIVDATGAPVQCA